MIHIYIPGLGKPTKETRYGDGQIINEINDFAYYRKSKVNGERYLISNFDNNTEFSHSSSHLSFNLLSLLEQNLYQKLRILEMIALNENILEIFDIQRKHFDKLTSTSGE